MSLPMPEPNRFAKPTGRFLFYIWDTKGIPEEQHPEPGVVIVTPTFDNLHIYGREMWPEDVDDYDRLRASYRVMGEFFSVACPEGELGTVHEKDLTYISAEEFSAAYQRGWLPKGEDK